MSLIARRQRSLLLELQKIQPNGHAIYVTEAKGSPWISVGDPPLDKELVDKELWTRSVLLNELLFDIDAPWGDVQRNAWMLTEALDEMGVPYDQYLTGGKGAHISIFFDHTKMQFDPADVPRIQRQAYAGMCVPSIARMTLAEALFDAAGIDRRWVPDGGPFDRLKVKWSSHRMGTQARIVGSRRSNGRRLTYVEGGSGFWCWCADWPDAPEMPLRWPPKPRLWDVPQNLWDRIVKNVLKQVDLRERLDEKKMPTSGALEAVYKFKRVPCVAKALEAPVPHGERHQTFKNFVAIARNLGVPRPQAERLLLKAMHKSGLDKDTDPDKWDLVAWAYRPGWTRSRLSCPSPMSARCEPSSCSFSHGLTFSGSR